MPFLATTNGYIRKWLKKGGLRQNLMGIAYPAPRGQGLLMPAEEEEVKQPKGRCSPKTLYSEQLFWRHGRRRRRGCGFGLLAAFVMMMFMSLRAGRGRGRAARCWGR